MIYDELESSWDLIDCFIPVDMHDVPVVVPSLVFESEGGAVGG